MGSRKHRNVVGGSSKEEQIMPPADKNIVYFSYDADSAGRKVGDAVLSDDPDKLSEISERIKLGNELVERWAKERNGKQYSSGGDQGVYAIPEHCVKELEQLRSDYNYLTGLTISVGIGKYLSESGQALLMAKLKGKDRIVEFNDKTKTEIESVKKRVKKGKFKSMEEYKLGSSYLNKGEPFQKPEPVSEDCQYCAQSDGTDSDHCKYCHDAETKDQCKYCSYDQPVDQALDFPELAEQDCQYCKQEDAKSQEECKYCNTPNDQSAAQTNAEGTGIAPNAMNPSADSRNDEAQAGSEKEREQYGRMGMNPPIIGKPLDPDQRPPIGQNAPMDTVPRTGFKDGADAADKSSTIENPPPSGKEEPRLNVEQKPDLDPEDNHSKEALTSIAQEMESDGKPPESEVDAIDDTQLTHGIKSDGNISRPEGYEQNIPTDMGLPGPNPPTDDEDGPDFTDVLEQGLNEQADSIQREKVIKTVSQALLQFKNSKQALENMKMQSPELYQASISMLKAMIDMASLLRLGQNSNQSPENMSQSPELGQVQESLMPAEQENPDGDWNDPFPVHPDQGGQPKPGHSPSKKNTEASVPKKEEGPPSPQL
jgi:minimal CRISPR polymerase domain